MKQELLERLKEKIRNKEQVDREEALLLADVPLEELTEAADELRRKFCGNGFDICTIINGKCGRCSEDCRYYIIPWNRICQIGPDIILVEVCEADVLCPRRRSGPLCS